MMYNFHYPKIIATVGGSLAKETVLSKVMNFVDGFVINLSGGFDDRQKKYIDTILKLDNSKTIMLETKGRGVWVKNVKDISLSQGDTIMVDFSEFLEEDPSIIYIDYAHLNRVTAGTLLSFGESDLVLEVLIPGSFGIQCKVIHAGRIHLDCTVQFEGFDPELSFLNQKDRKDIQRGLQGGIHIMVGSAVMTVEDMHEMRAFLTEQRDEHKKIVARFETVEALSNAHDIIDYVDGIVVVRDALLGFASEEEINNLIVYAKDQGKSVVVTLHYGRDLADDKKKAESLLAGFIALSVDGYMLGEETATGDTPLEVINGLYDLLMSLMPQEKVRFVKPFYEKSERDVIDYILYNVYRIIDDLDIRAVVCYTNTGYSAARLASFRPMIPIIAFTKSDDTYRYINTLWGVKGYKISLGFSYDNLKKIGKEMIRIMFKGSISLDEKIVIVQVNESVIESTVTDQANMINGIELYRFKDI